MFCTSLVFDIYLYILHKPTLELFSGAGSVGNACIELCFEVISLDRDMEADTTTDIVDGVIRCSKAFRLDLGIISLH